MTYFGGQQPEAKADTATRQGWATCLGIACAIGILGFIALGMGLAFGTLWGLPTGFGLLSLAAVVACAGGYAYFLYQRYE